MDKESLEKELGIIFEKVKKLKIENKVLLDKLRKKDDSEMDELKKENAFLKKKISEYEEPLGKIYKGALRAWAFVKKLDDIVPSE